MGIILRPIDPFSKLKQRQLVRYYSSYEKPPLLSPTLSLRIPTIALQLHL